MANSLRVLILGGTAEASAVARGLAGDGRFDPVLSYAGRTRAPAAQPIPVRSGGFGGAAGLADWLRAHGTEALVDATHPFAARISANARTAAAATAVAVVHLLRPPWTPVAGDRWTVVPTVADAAAALGATPRRVFVTVGGTDLLPFASTPHRLLVRTVDPPACLPDGAALIHARGPFRVDDEEDLLRQERIDVLVTKNSGGAATMAKLHAARRLGLPVVVVARPPAPDGPTVPDAAGVLAWLHAQATLRGV